MTRRELRTSVRGDSKGSNRNSGQGSPNSQRQFILYNECDSGTRIGPCLFDDKRYYEPEVRTIE